MVLRWSQDGPAISSVLSTEVARGFAVANTGFLGGFASPIFLDFINEQTFPLDPSLSFSFVLLMGLIPTTILVFFIFCFFLNFFLLLSLFGIRATKKWMGE